MKQLLLTLLKYAALPFAVIYGIVVFIRNKFYDWKIFDSIEFSLPVICVGNITVGGTGKTPHIEYLIELLSSQYKIATLSRGYRRHSRGFKMADDKSNARDIGDEPFQYKSKYPQLEVCVAEERMTAIPQLLQLRQQVQVILLDDAFQHRTVRPGMNILLTDYGRLYTRDYIMPFGLLRESRQSAQRAHIIIVSKCPFNMDKVEKEALRNELNPLPDQQVYFSSIQYKKLYPLGDWNTMLHRDTVILMVTGIANPLPLEQHLRTQFDTVHTLPYKDHHYFTFDDLNEIEEAFKNIKSDKKVIVTTEKDAARLMLLKEKIVEKKLPFYAQAIGMEILFDEGEKLNENINAFVKKYYPEVEVDPNPILSHQIIDAEIVDDMQDPNTISREETEL
jgi:tetraacyldisaccharide 4'-kinase